MRRGVLAGLLWLGVALLGAVPAHAASDLELRHAPDGTWHVIGSGWRPRDQVVVSMGVARYPADVDGAGDFDVPTGLTTYQRPLAVHHVPAMNLATRTTAPSSLAAVLVHGLAEGAAIMSLMLGLLLLGLGIRRWQQAGRT